VPPDTGCAAKPVLALAMMGRAIAAGVPVAWVAADSVDGAVAMASRRAGKGYVPGVNAPGRFNAWGDKPRVAGTAAAIASALDPSPGIVDRPGSAARASACLIRPIWNWPTSMQPNTTRPGPVFGPGAF
jgi:hypothetical protein